MNFEAERRGLRARRGVEEEDATGVTSMLLLGLGLGEGEGGCRSLRPKTDVKVAKNHQNYWRTSNWSLSEKLPPVALR